MSPVKHATMAANLQMIAMFRSIAASLEASDEQGRWPEEEKVRQAYGDLVAWDRWLDRNRRAMPADELRFHEFTLRWAKGIVKSWRIALATGKAG